MQRMNDPIYTYINNTASNLNKTYYNINKKVGLDVSRNQDKHA